MKQLLLSFLIFYSVSLLASPVDCLTDNLKSEIQFGHAVFSEINSNTNLKSMSNIYSQLREVTDNKLVKNLEAKRLINPEDWEQASQTLKTDVWRAYGDKTIEDWFKGREYILSLPKNQTIDSSLLKNIHKIVTKNHKFHGFEGRRLLERLKNEEISRKEFDELKVKAFEKNEEVSGVSHTSLQGAFRKDSVDQIIHRGSSFKEDGSRYFTKSELDELRKNKYVTVQEDSIKQIGENTWTGVSYYEDVAKVEQAVENILKKRAEQLKKAKSKREIVSIVVLMEKDLVSVHPFLDGNGRTIRLLGDYILSQYKLPPSLYPNELDLTMPLKSAVEFRLNGMRDYLKEHQKELKQSQ